MFPMNFSAPTIGLLGILAVLSVVVLFRRTIRFDLPIESYIYYPWILFLSFVISDVISFAFGIWVLAVLCFLALREFVTLIDIRIQDRLGVLGSYLSIPFMIYLIQIDAYSLFIISIPLCVFLTIPFLIALGGGDSRGAVFTIGALDFGLLLLVYCTGHIGYLARISTWMAAFLVLAIMLSDLFTALFLPGKRGLVATFAIRYVLSAPLVVGLAVALSPMTGIPIPHAVVLGLLIPALVNIGRFTILCVEEDLGIDVENLRAGRGGMIHGLKSFLYTAPVVFHYVRYYLT
jgi:phosphatidate cytidylyltransferase